MNTIADFKRKMTIGSQWTAHHEFMKDGVPTSFKDLGTRTCGHVQSNSFAFTTPEGKLSWCDWPKKSDFHPIDENTVIIKNDYMRLTYILKPEQVA